MATQKTEYISFFFSHALKSSAKQHLLGSCNSNSLFLILNTKPVKNFCYIRILSSQCFWFFFFHIPHSHCGFYCTILCYVFYLISVLFSDSGFSLHRRDSLEIFVC